MVSDNRDRYRGSDDHVVVSRLRSRDQSTVQVGSVVPGADVSVRFCVKPVNVWVCSTRLGSVDGRNLLTESRGIDAPSCSHENISSDLHVASDDSMRPNQTGRSHSAVVDVWSMRHAVVVRPVGFH